MGTAITGTQMRTLKASVVTELPDKGVSNKIYYVPNDTTGDNKYDEYIWIKDADHPNGYFEKVGQKDINLEPYALTEEVDEKLKTKVDKVTGYGLSKNDFTDILKNKLDGIAEGAQVNSITGVKGSSEETYRTGNVSISASNIGLGNVNNTSDADKPISIAQQAALNKKVDKVSGKSLSTHDFTDSYKTSLDNWFNRSRVRPTMSLSDLENKKDIPAGIYPISDGVQLWKYLVVFPRTLAGTSTIELLANSNGNTLKYRLYLIDIDKLSSWKTLATTDVATSTADGLMSKEDKVGFTNLKSTNFSYIGANNINPFTATKTGVTLNYASYNSNLWGSKGANHSESLPVASSTQAGIITAADKVKLDSLAPKEQLFIDMWNSACGTYGKYNAETGFYELNGLTDITYEQALAIYNNKLILNNEMRRVLAHAQIRTILTIGSNNGADVGGCNLALFAQGSSIEIFDGHRIEVTSSSDWMFNSCSRLTSVKGMCLFFGTTGVTFGCVNLKTLYITISGNVNFSNLPLLTYDSFDYIIKASNPSSIITIKVHPTTYAYLQGTTPPTEQVGGTTEQWQALVTAATNKKISFATTE